MPSAPKSAIPQARVDAQTNPSPEPAQPPSHTRPRAQHIAGAVMALVGCWLLIGRNSSGFSAQNLDGYLVAFACALIWSSYSVLSRLVKSVPTDAVGWFCGVTAVLAWMCHLMWEQTVWPDGASQWVGVVGLGLGPVGIAFFTWDYGVKHGNIQLLGTLAYSAPLISVILLIVFGFGEATMAVAGASTLIVSGSLVAGKTRNTETAKTVNHEAV